MVRFNHAFKEYRRKTMYPLNPYIFGGSIPMSGLVMELLFTNSVYDSATTSRTFTNTAITFTDGKYGRCASFNGTNSQILLNQNAVSTNNFTISVWIYQTAQNGYRALFSPLSGQGGLWLTDGKLNWYQNAPNFATSIPIQLNTWTHLAFTSNGSQIKGYINGVIANTLNLNAVVISSNYIGGRNGQYIAGFMDNYRVYNRELTQSEITQLFNES